MIKFLNSANPDQAEILIHEEIGENWFGDGLTSKAFVEKLSTLGSVKNIKVRINSPGGSVTDGVAIYNALRTHGARIDVVVEGMAASIASVIAMAGHEIRMGVGAMMMVHSPWTIVVGNADDMRTMADELDKFTEALVDVYEIRTKRKRADIKKMLEADTWMTAAEALDNGFADSMDQVEEETEKDIEALNASIARFDSFVRNFRAKSQKLPLQKIAAALIPAAVAAKPVVAKVEVTPVDENEVKAKAEAAAKAAQAARIKAIQAAFSAFPQLGELQSACIADVDCTADAAREKILAELAKDATPHGSSTRATIEEDETDKFVAGISNAVLARHNVRDEEGKQIRVETGNEYAGIRLQRLCRVVLRRAGVTGVDRLEGHQLASKVFAQMSTSDFPMVLSNTANKALRAAYDTQPHTWNLWAAVGQVSDFKQNTRLQLGSFNSLAVIPEGGEYQFAGMGEEREFITAQTKGRAISLTRQMIINDDLGVFVTRATRLGAAAQRTVNEDVYARLTSNPTMNDTGALFNTTVVTTAGGHANLTTGAGVPTVVTIGALEAKLAAQKDKDLRTMLNLPAANILVPRVLKATTWEVLNSPTDPSQANPGKRNYAQTLGLNMVSDGELDKASATAWYILTDPNIAPVIEIDFLDGVQTPFTDEMVDFHSDAVILKVRLDYGTAAIDWRGGQKHNGA